MLIGYRPNSNSNGFLCVSCKKSWHVGCLKGADGAKCDWKSLPECIKNILMSNSVCDVCSKTAGQRLSEPIGKAADLKKLIMNATQDNAQLFRNELSIAMERNLETVKELVSSAVEDLKEDLSKQIGTSV